jgi:prepilin-type N-terminal cleavage/methylation domain-containing protein
MTMSRRIRGGAPGARRGITLIEVLVTVTVLGIAGMLIIPAMGQVDVLRAQASVRTLVADITFAQADAAATQERRAILFGAVGVEQPDGTVAIEDGHGYTIFAPAFGANQVSLAFDAMPDPTSPGQPITRDFNSEVLQGGTLMDVNFDCELQQGYQALLFDEFGGPVRDLTSDTPSEGGSLVVMGRMADYRIDVLPITGRVVVTRTPRAPEPEAGEE